MSTPSSAKRNPAADGEEDLAAAYAAALDGMGQVQVLVIGATGAGKSTLINAFFAGEPARTGTGRPVTKETKYYDTANGLLRIYDTRGIETGDSRNRIVKWVKSTATANAVDVAWFCVRASDARVDGTQLDLIRTLSQVGIPVVVVLTQVNRRADGEMSPSTMRFLEEVTDDLRQAGARAIVPTAAKVDGWSTPTVHGLKELYRATHRLVPQKAQDAFDAVQRVDWELKRQKARRATRVAAVAAASVAAAPVPLSDSVGIIPVQVALLAKIAATYGIVAKPNELAAIAGPIVVERGATFVGKALFKAVLKSFPGANLAVGVVATGVAGLVTEALGEAWMWTCEALARAGSVIDVDVPQLRREFQSAFEQVVAIRKAA